MRLLAVSFALLLLASAVGAADGTGPAIYPANPNISPEAVFISGSGVTRLEYDGLKPSWHSLEGLFPFEPVVSGEVVVVGSQVGVFALAADSGQVIWHLPSNGLLFTPTVVDRTAYIGGEDGMVRAVDVGSGKEQWHHQLSGWVFSPAVVENSVVTGGGDGTLWGLDRDDGHEEWNKPIGEELIFPPMAGSDEPVYVSTAYGNVMALGASNGDLRWQTSLSTPSTTTVYGKRLFLTQISGLVTAHDRYSGKKLWEFQMDGPTTMPVRVIDGKLFAVTEEGNSVMLDPENGNVIEEIRAPDEGTPAHDGNEILTRAGD